MLTRGFHRWERAPHGHPWLPAVARPLWNGWDDRAVEEVIAEDLVFRGSLGVRTKAEPVGAPIETWCDGDRPIFGTSSSIWSRRGPRRRPAGLQRPSPRAAAGPGQGLHEALEVGKRPLRTSPCRARSRRACGFVTAHHPRSGRHVASAVMRGAGCPRHTGGHRETRAAPKKVATGPPTGGTMSAMLGRNGGHNGWQPQEMARPQTTSPKPL